MSPAWHGRRCTDAAHGAGSATGSAYIADHGCVQVDACAAHPVLVPLVVISTGGQLRVLADKGIIGSGQRARPKIAWAYARLA